MVFHQSTRMSVASSSSSTPVPDSAKATEVGAAGATEPRDGCARARRAANELGLGQGKTHPRAAFSRHGRLKFEQSGFEDR
jgi:hypothetical protein